MPICTGGWATMAVGAAERPDTFYFGAASRSDYGSLTFRDWHPVGGDERDYMIPDPEDADLVYGSFGASWTEIDTGLPPGEFVSVVRSDSKRRGLLYAGTAEGVHVSFDDGAHWQPLQLNLPKAWVRDLLVHDDDLIAATQGRAIWVLDDVTPLRQLAAPVLEGSAHLFTPAVAWRVHPNNNRDTPLSPETAVGQNPPAGAVIDYWLGGDTSPADLHSLLKFNRALDGALEKAHVANASRKAVHEQLEALTHRLAGDASHKALLEEATALREATNSRKDETDFGAISDRLAALTADTESADLAPTPAQQEVFTYFSNSLDESLRAWQAQRESALAQLNAHLQAAHLSVIDVPAHGKLIDEADRGHGD